MKNKNILQTVILWLIISLSATSILFADCFTVLVGKKVSSDGSVLFGHNEQNGGRRIVNYSYIPRIKHKPGTMVILKNGGMLPEVEETYAMLWQQNPGIEFGDSYFNEWGVAVASDGCGTREDSYEKLIERGDISDGGIGYMLRRLVAQRAKTAREGVKIAGDLLNRFGYSSSGRSLVIADPNEAWVISIARGKHWIAQRCPDDEVVLLPNIHIIGSEANLIDTNNVIASPGLVDYAIKRGWYDPSTKKPFNFREAFNRTPSEGSFMGKYGVDPRQWYAQSLVIGKFIGLPVKEQLPFSVKPAHKLTVNDVAKILRSHLEGTEFDTSEKYSSPHMMKGLGVSICSKGTQEGAVYQLRSWMPAEIGCLVWRTTAAPCSGVLTPWYIGITDTPSVYYKAGDIIDQLDISNHFNYFPENFAFDPDFAFDIFNELENQTDISYKRAIKIVRSVWDPFERTQFEIQPAIEEVAIKLFKENKSLAKEFLTEYTHARALLAIEKTKELNRKLKTIFWAN